MLSGLTSPQADAKAVPLHIDELAEVGSEHLGHPPLEHFATLGLEPIYRQSLVTYNDASDLDPQIRQLRHSIEHAHASQTDAGVQTMRSYPTSDRLEVATPDHVAFAFDTLVARLNNPEGMHAPPSISPDL